jgi:hypothetical protein
MVESYNPVPVLEERDNATPHGLVAPKPMRKQQHRPIDPTTEPNVMPFHEI